MRLSIRVRLTFWYTAFFALFLGVIAVAGYGFLAAVTLTDVDDLLSRSAASVSAAMEFERESGAADSAAVVSVAAGLRFPDVAITVLDEATRTATPAAPHPTPRVAVAPAVRRALDDTLDLAVRRAPRHFSITSTSVQAEPVRILTLPYRLGRRDYIVGVAQVMDARELILREARLGLLVAIPLLLALASGGGYWLAGKSLAPVSALTVRAGEIGAQNLHERLPVGNRGDELDQLATVLNALLVRVQEAFEAQSRFVAEASHELRTPVAVISGESEHALARPGRSAEALRESLEVIHAEGLRLRSAIDDLFFLARADAGERRLREDATNLAELAESAVRAARGRAGAREISLDSTRAPANPIVADAELVRRVVDNLLDNAIKYSTPGGPIAVAVAMRDGVALVDVADAGPGVPEPMRDRLFERFFRGDDARTRSSDGGAGLGLAIARWAARAHGGDVRLEESGPARCVFRLTLPARNFPA